MPETVPPRFRSVADAVEDVSREFGSGGGFRSLGGRRWIREIGVEWEAPIANVSFFLDEVVAVLAVYVTFRLPGARRRAGALAKSVARASYGLLPGSFEVDVDTGEVRYRSTLNVAADSPDRKGVAQLLAEALVTAKTYAPAFEAVARGTDPRRAIDDVEGAGT